MRIEWNELSEDKLSRVCWCFYVRSEMGNSELKVSLDRYSEEHRESTRKRSFIVDKIYSRIGDLRLVHSSKKLSKEDVKITEEIKNKVIEEISKSIKFEIK